MKKAVKVVKRSHPPVPSSLVKVPVVGNEWTKIIRSWVVEFQQRSQERLPVFDSLFKRELLTGDPHDEKSLPAPDVRKPVD